MKKVSFTKTNGAGNDFIVIDKREYPGISLAPETLRRLTDRNSGIGADGVFFVDSCNSEDGELAGLDFKVEFFNPDGTSGMLCGNGARCAIMYAWKNGFLSDKTASFLFNGKIYSGVVISEKNVRFNIISEFNTELVSEKPEIPVSCGILKGDLLDTGCPHTVIEVNDANFAVPNLDLVPVDKLGKEVRYNGVFQPAGTNADFYQVKDSIVYLRTYERCVEYETNACGTGATATAIVCYLRKNMQPPISIITRKGDLLTVDMDTDGPVLRNVTLCGPAEITFTGTVEI